MDMYFDRTDFLFGADPDCVNGFRGSTWREIFNGDLNYPDTSIRVYK